MRLTKIFLAGLMGIVITSSAWAQYTNWPNGSAGTTTGSILLLDVVSSPPTNYQNGQVQPGTQDTAGNINVNCQIGCSATSDPANGPVTPGTAATKSKLGGAIFNTSPPALASGQQGALQVDSVGSLLVNIKTQGTSPSDGPVAPGTAAANSKLIAGIFNSSPPTATNGQQVALQTDANGFLKVNISAGGASGGTSSTFGAAFPSLGTAIGAKNGANMVNLAADGSNNLFVNCAVGCSAGTGANNADAVAAVGTGLNSVVGYSYIFNGTTWDRWRGSSGSANVTLGAGSSVSLVSPSAAPYIGAVGGITNAITVNPTITAGAYSAGFCLGSLETFANLARTPGVGSSPGSGIIQSAVITDKAGQDASVDLILFNANPTNSTFTDHAACTVNNLDLPKIIGVIHVTDCQLEGATTPGSCQAQQQAMPFALGTGNTTGYAVAIVRGTPTYLTTSDLGVRLGVFQD